MSTTTLSFPAPALHPTISQCPAPNSPKFWPGRKIKLYGPGKFRLEVKEGRLPKFVTVGSNETVKLPNTGSTGAAGPNPEPVKEKVLVIKPATATRAPAHTPKRASVIKSGTNRLLFGCFIEVVSPLN